MFGPSMKSWRSWMPEWLRDRIRHAQLVRRLKVIDDRWLPQIDAARSEPEKDRLKQLRAQASAQWEIELVMLRSKMLRRRADRWDVEIPDDAQAEAGGGVTYITHDGQHYVVKSGINLPIWLGFVHASPHI